MFRSFATVEKQTKALLGDNYRSIPANIVYKILEALELKDGGEKVSVSSVCLYFWHCTQFEIKRANLTENYFHSVLNTADFNGKMFAKSFFIKIFLPKFSLDIKSFSKRIFSFWQKNLTANNASRNDLV